MDLYFIIKTLHIITSTILFGTGLGIAFFMFRSHYTNDIQEKYYAARNTVLADYLFTFPAVVLQPITGLWLISSGSFDWSAFWLVLTYIIYVIVGMCWIPVVWIQVKLKNMLSYSIDSKTPLPSQYYKLFKIWFMLGWPAFFGLIIVFYLMVAKPV